MFDARCSVLGARPPTRTDVPNQQPRIRGDSSRWPLGNSSLTAEATIHAPNGGAVPPHALEPPHSGHLRLLLSTSFSSNEFLSPCARRRAGRHNVAPVVMMIDSAPAGLHLAASIKHQVPYQGSAAPACLPPSVPPPSSPSIEETAGHLDLDPSLSTSCLHHVSHVWACSFALSCLISPSHRGPFFQDRLLRYNIAGPPHAA